MSVYALILQQSIIRPLTNEEYGRLAYYAPRVKRIQELCPLFPPRFHGNFIFETSVIAALASRWSMSQLLFPNVHVLRLDPARDQYRYLHALFGPQLRQISSDAAAFPGMQDVDSEEYRQMLVMLQEMAPLLTHFELKIDGVPFREPFGLPFGESLGEPLGEPFGELYPSTILSAMYATLRSFKHLVSVRTGALPIDMQTFRYLASLPQLEFMEARPADHIVERDFRWLYTSGHEVYFPSLREIYLQYDMDPGPLSTVLQHIRSSRLNVIHVKPFGQTVVSLDRALHLLSVVLSRSGMESITQLSITMPTQRLDGAALHEQHLEPLLRLGRLTHLKLRFGCPVVVTEAMLRRAAEAWPNIRELTLDPDFSQTESPVTLASLFPFAQKCPHLVVLGLPIDARLSLLSAELLHQARAGLVNGICPLERLIVGESDLLNQGSPMEYAEFLLDIFPRLRRVSSRLPHMLWLELSVDSIPRVARQRGREWKKSLDEPVRRVWGTPGLPTKKR